MALQHTAFSDSKSHYEILDGLRGVAAVMVVIFHVFETFTGGNHLEQLVNHGYLAVDFFFALSGFVIGYAYDDRWGKMGLRDFFARRLIRLHPMIIAGMVIGAITFYLQICPSLFPRISETPLLKMALFMLIGFTLLPVPNSIEIRGWTEMYPLNGPAWTLFYEYVGNILYALFIRRLPTTILAVLTFAASCATVHLAVTSPNGDVIGGWSLDPAQVRIGVTRLLYPFLAGLLLSRIVKPGRIRHAFMWCSLLVIGILAFPRVGGEKHLWMNGLYDSFAILILFPLIVYLGASGEAKGKYVSKLCRFFGDISYPIYITHYPLIYVYTAWVCNNELTLQQGLPVGGLVVLSAITLAYASFKLYDVPVRSWLTARFMARSKA